MSTQSARPSLRDLERAAGYTPKVKLGPRPSLDQSGRPRTSGSSRNPDQRPVASMPAGMRPSSVRKPPSINEIPRPRSQGSSFATKPNSRAPPIPPLLVPPPSIPISRPPLSPGAKSLGALSTSSGLTPEKERLMKALQQRRKQMAKRAEQTKKKQAMADVEEEEEAKETKMKEPVRNEEENKENINLAPQLAESPKIEAEIVPGLETKLEPEKPQEIQAHGNLAEPQMPVPEPSEVPEQPQDLGPPGPEEDQPSACPEAPAPESLQEQVTIAPENEQVSPETSKDDPELIADAAVSDSECPSSHTSDPSADTTLSTDRAETPLEPAKSETPQTFIEIEGSEVETLKEPTDSAISDPIETKDDLVPPSAYVQVPLTEEAANATPELGNASPVQLPEVAPVVDEQKEEAATEEAVPADFPETLTIPILPPVESSPSPVVEPPVAPVTVSIEPVRQDETSPEEQHISTLAPPLPPLDQRRRKHLEPIQVPTQEFSDDDCLLSDDSFMEELRSATVQEARPVSVKSPNGGDQSWKGSRAVSSPYLTSPSAMQALAVGRSASSSHVDNGSSTPVLMAKKINVSSGISSRIKALEKFSSREGTASGPTPLNGPSASSSFEELRKRASVSFPNGTIPDFSRAPSVNHHDARPVSSNRRTNSISVTARIVRDTSVSPGSSGIEPSESDVLNLQASPLTVEQHETNDEISNNQTVESPAPTVEDRTMSMSSAGSSRQVTPVSRPASRLSLSSRSKADENSQSASPTDEKKGSRASRLMRRMSSMTSTSRRSIIGALSPPVKEESAVSPLGNSAISNSSSRQTLSEPVEIGEVNVQFPETLLWKRRFMRIDEDGYVVLTPGTNDASARNMIKRYHLSEFRTPCLPDEDMQELPNSILLDFLDGSTLQCACESRQGQSWTLQSKLSLPC